MDNDFYMNDFERLLRDKTEEFKMYPSESVWTNIFNKLHPGRRWGIIGGSVLLLLFTASVLVLRTNNNTTAKKEANHDKSGQSELLENKPQHSEGINTTNPNQSGNNRSTSLNNTAADNISLNNSNNFRLNNSLSIIPSYNTIVVDNINNNSGITVVDAKNDYNNITTVNLPEESNNYSFADYSPDLSYAVPEIHTKAPALSGLNVYVNANSYNKSIKKEALKKASRFEWQLYFAPSASYRALYNDDNSANLAYAYNNYIPGDIDKAVNHTPALGFELGNAVLYSLSKTIKLKAGLQFNYSRYNIKAYSTSYPELTTIRLRGDFNQPQELRVVSSYKNYGAFYQATTIGSQNVAVSVPFGVDVKMAGNNKISWYLAGSFQPTYILNNKAYLITNDLKNYVQNSELFRRFTMNTGVETFLRFERNNGVALQIGPQIRYQINSSYTTKYPISEHLIEYGLKVGLTKKF